MCQVQSGVPSGSGQEPVPTETFTFELIPACPWDLDKVHLAIVP